MTDFDVTGATQQPRNPGSATTPRKETERPQTLRRWLKSTSNRTFVVYPVLIALFEFLLHGRDMRIVPWGIPLFIWGYLQYRLCGNYRTRLGGGGPGLSVPPERIVEQGVYRYLRNPMYLGHMIFMLGLAITFWSWAALLLLAFHLFWFNERAKEDEAHLEALFGAPYVEYRTRVKRWIPGVY
jgi:protein-S-isoprenylcysteine O-methyltransferase Ste14